MAERRKRPRDPGQGSITQLPDGRWRARLPRDPVTGERKAWTDKRRQVVLEKLARALADRAQGRTLPKGTERLGPFLTRWLDDVKRPRLEPSTYARYAVILRLHLLPGLGRRRLDALTAEDLHRFYARLLAGPKPPSAATLRLYHSILTGALRTAERWGLIARNPAQLVGDLPKLPRREPTVLSPDPARQLLAAARGDPREALYVLALSTGMRVGELLGLQWASVDLAAGVLRVERKLLYVNRAVVEGAPKSTAGLRVVELTPRAVDALRAHRSHQAALRLLVGAAWARPDLVFTTATGLPQRATTVTGHYLPRLLAQAGLPRMTMHMLRHSMASLMLSQGEDVSVVSRMLGHSSVAMTYGVYRHILPGEQRAAVARYGALLEGD